MDWEKQTRILMLITVPDKTKIIIFCGTWHRGLWWICIKPLLTLFLSLVTQNLLRTVALGYYRRRTKSAGRDFQLNRSKQSTTRGNAQWESDCPRYDWISFLGQYFKKLPNITKFHHFRFSQENPSMVFYKGFVSSPEQSFMLLKRNIILPPSLTLPNKINPEGLTEERKNYLYRKNKAVL